MQSDTNKLTTEVSRGDFCLDGCVVRPTLNLVVSPEGKSIRLEPKAMLVLLHLVQHAPEVVSKEDLMNAVWGDTFVTDQVLANAIWQLRLALGRDSIETIPKSGYRLVGQISSLKPPRNGESTTAPSTAPIVENQESRVARTTVEDVGRDRRSWIWLAGIVAAVLLVIGLSAFYFFHIRVTPHSADRVTLAVLPFLNLSGDSDQEYFSDGITDEMIFQLGVLQPDHLAVIARGSAMTYKGSHKRLDEIGKELHVQYIVEGSVRRTGPHVRITAQLIEAAPQVQVWAQDYDGTVTDVPAFQRAISRSIAEHIRLTLTPLESARLQKPEQINESAYDLYLKGRFCWNQRTAESLYRAIRYFEQSVGVDPNFTPAYVGIADSYWVLNEWNVITTADAAINGKPNIAKALELDSRSAEAHAARAAAAMNYDWDWAGAEAEFKKALLLNPSYAPAHQWYAEYLSGLGRNEEALIEIHKAQALDPYSSIVNSVAALTLAHSQRYDEAIAECNKVLKSNPDFYPAHQYLAQVYYSQGNLDAALAEIRKAGTIGGVWQALSLEIEVAKNVKSGNLAQARSLASRAAALTAGRPNEFVAKAQIYTALGDKDRAFASLQKAVQLRERDMRSLQANPVLATLQSDPRFIDLLTRMRIPH